MKQQLARRSRAGTDVAQLYLALPPPAPDVVQPPRQLKGFRRVTLDPGETKRVTMRVDQRALAYWDVDSDGWQVAPGCYGVMLGRSSRDIVQRATLAVGGARCPGAAASVRTPKACASRRTVLVHLRGVRRSQVRRVVVYVDGARQRVLRGARRAVRVTLAGRAPGVVRVRLVVFTRSGRTHLERRAYRVCA